MVFECCSWLGSTHVPWHEMGYTLDRSPFNHMANTEKERHFRQFRVINSSNKHAFEWK